ncbi:hemolysin XhlA family protein [Paenibacillus sp. GM2]|uniref:hemolysin XhlA family protein n=1 Tax=Paenibacillus sp. GM2 TaxID=1622070 RepID=UPI000839C782|nr:hemolysin XhlA family protein [Paenibacillus sp. GM2]
MGSEQAALNDISVKVGRLEAMQENSTKAITDMAASVNRLVEKLDRSDDVAKEALDKSKSAHKRLDGIDKIIFWVSTTIIGLVLVALVGLVITKS